jgi:hypothetical protein
MFVLPSYGVYRFVVRIHYRKVENVYAAGVLAASVVFDEVNVGHE